MRARQPRAITRSFASGQPAKRRKPMSDRPAGGTPGPRYWKVLDAQGLACHGGTFQYDLPKGSKPGKWTPTITDMEPCTRGYHLCRDADLIGWCNNATIWAAEPRGRIIEQSDKVVC